MGDWFTRMVNDPAFVTWVGGGLLAAFGFFIKWVDERSGLVEGFRSRLRQEGTINLKGTWVNTWADPKNGAQSADITITHQAGKRISGFVEMKTKGDLRWDLEGIFDGRFLQLFAYPSRQAKNKFFTDSWSYFMETKGKGFEGYSVGYDADTDAVEMTSDKLIRA